MYYVDTPHRMACRATQISIHRSIDMSIRMSIHIENILPSVLCDILHSDETNKREALHVSGRRAKSPAAAEVSCAPGACAVRTANQDCAGQGAWPAAPT